MCGGGLVCREEALQADSLVAKKGHVCGDEVQAVLNAGYSRGAVLEVVAQAAHTTMANLAHSISQAPVDQAFAAQAWEAA
jgi:alkylhydroperoxidase family enzyme